MEHRIGTIVTLPDGRKAEVVEAKKNQGCDVCFFGNNGGCDLSEIKESDDTYCSPSFRLDMKRVIYKEVKND